MDYSKLLATSAAALGLGVAVLPGCRNEPNAALLAGTAVAGTTVGTEIDDTIVTTRVHSALMADASVNSSDITVVARQGEVQLSGFLNNQRQIERAVLVARGVPDVASVSNEMRVKQ